MDEVKIFKTECQKEREERDLAIYNEYNELMSVEGQSRTLVTEHLMKKYQELAAEKGFSLWQEDSESSRTASEKGIASASQDSVDELNGRMTAVQGHTFSISENTKLLVSNTQAILRSVMGIENNTNDLPSRLTTMESSLKSIRDTVDDIALKGIKIQ